MSEQGTKPKLIRRIWKDFEIAGIFELDVFFSSRSKFWTASISYDTFDDRDRFLQIRRTSKSRDEAQELAAKDFDEYIRTGAPVVERDIRPLEQLRSRLAEQLKPSSLDRPAASQSLPTP